VSVAIAERHVIGPLIQIGPGRPTRDIRRPIQTSFGLSIAPVLVHEFEYDSSTSLNIFLVPRI